MCFSGVTLSISTARSCRAWVWSRRTVVTIRRAVVRRVREVVRLRRRHQRRRGWTTVRRRLWRRSIRHRRDRRRIIPRCRNLIRDLNRCLTCRKGQETSRKRIIRTWCVRKIRWWTAWRRAATEATTAASRIFRTASRSLDLPHLLPAPFYLTIILPRSDRATPCIPTIPTPPTTDHQLFKLLFNPMVKWCTNTLDLAALLRLQLALPYRLTLSWLRPPLLLTHLLAHPPKSHATIAAAIITWLLIARTKQWRNSRNEVNQKIINDLSISWNYFRQDKFIFLFDNIDNLNSKILFPNSKIFFPILNS